MWLRCMCASVKRTRFPGKCSDDGDACTQICVKSNEMSIIFNSSKFDSRSHNSNVNVWKLNGCLLSLNNKQGTNLVCHIALWCRYIKSLWFWSVQGLLHTQFLESRWTLCLATTPSCLTNLETCWILSWTLELKNTVVSRLFGRKVDTMKTLLVWEVQVCCIETSWCLWRGRVSLRAAECWLETSKTVAVTLELQFGSRILMKMLVYCANAYLETICAITLLEDLSCARTAQQLWVSWNEAWVTGTTEPWKKWYSVRKMKISSGVEFSINSILLRHSWWILNHLVHNDFVGTSELTKNLSQELSKDMTMRWGMADDSYAKKKFGGLVWSESGCRRSSLPKPQNTSRNEQWDITVRYTKVHSITSQELELQVQGRHVLWQRRQKRDIVLWDRHVPHMSSWCEHQDDSWYGYVYNAEWRSAHSWNSYMSLLWRSTTLDEYDLVQPQHVEVCWWTDQYEGNVRTVCRTTFTTTLLSALWLANNNVTQSSLRTDTWPGECLIV